MEKVFQKNFLDGQVVLITGGATGIMRTIAERLIEYGASVAIASRKLDNLTKAVEEIKASKKSDKIFPVKCDVRKYDDCEKAVEATLAKFKKIDHLFNGAAGNFLAPIAALSSNAFRTVMEIDALGTFHMSKAVFSAWFKDHPGTITNISATLHYSGTAMQTHAGSAKAAIDAMTKHFAVELGPKNIRVNGIAPGPIADTEGMSRLGGTSNKFNLEDYIPLQRLGYRDDIAGLALYLISPAASYITGQTIVCDGGQMLTVCNGPLFYDTFFANWVKPKPKLQNKIIIFC